ncbi:glycosyltransferase [Fidelibacter multiformis]|uniref:glycosyltransferase n=1 Tax=Fidelibacter multiformis TaxID=3377529 RepID=UPI0037DC1BD6
MENNPKIMLHLIMPNQISGPNNAAKLIFNSWLNKKYEFGFLTQNFHAGGKISFSLIKSLKKQIDSFNPDIIHLSGLQASGFHAVVAARLAKKKKIIIAVRGSSTDVLNSHWFKKFIFGWIIEPVTLKLASHVYTVSKAMVKKRMIKKFSENFIGTIHNSAPEINANSIEPVYFRKKNNIDTSKILVAIVGRMVYDKGITFIIEAIKSFSPNHFSFVFIGDGPLISEMKKKLEGEIKEGRVFLLGHQKNVLPILAECDVFLFATLHENLSNALLEACSLGLIPIVTNVGGNPEVIKHKENGILVTPKDSKSIIDALKFINNNPKIASELSANAKKTVDSEFSQKKLLQHVDDLYQKLLVSN